jgi:predicted amidophosphoribosyltransferase
MKAEQPLVCKNCGRELISWHLPFCQGCGQDVRQ